MIAFSAIFACLLVGNLSSAFAETPGTCNDSFHDHSAVHFSIDPAVEGDGTYWVKPFSDGSLELHIKDTDVAFRNVEVVIPTEFTADTLIKTLALIRTSRTLGAATVSVTSPLALSKLRVVDSHQKKLSIPVENLLRTAGAASVRELGRPARPTRQKRSLKRAAGAQPAWIMNSSYPGMSQKLSAATGLPRFERENGEWPENSQVYLVASFGENANEHLVQAWSDLNELVRRGNKVVIISPFPPYARADKVDYPGETTVGGKLIADLIEAMGPQGIVFVRAHAAQTQGFFSTMYTENLSGRATMLPVLKAEEIDEIFSADEGAAKENGRTARLLDIGTNMANKVRDLLTGKLKIVGIQKTNVAGLKLAGLDDIIDTGTTISDGADVLVHYGVKSYIIFIIHMTGTAEKALANENILKMLVTDTVPVTISNPKLIVVSVAPEIAESILRFERSRQAAVERLSH